MASERPEAPFGRMVARERDGRGARARILCVCLFLLGSPAALALPMPVSADLDHPLAEGWDVTTACSGPLALFPCIDDTLGHVLTIQFDDASVVQFAISLEPAQVLSSLTAARPHFQELTSAGGQLEALNASFLPYSTTSYDLFVIEPTAYEDFDLTEFEPAHFRYTQTGLGTFLLLGDGSGHFSVPVPEPTSLVLIGSGLLGVGLYRRRSLRPGGTNVSPR